MKILLIHPPHRYHGNSRKELFFPIGLGYIAGAILEEGHEVNILDIHALDLADEEVINTIRSSIFDVVGISAMSTQYKYVKWLSSRIKELHKDKKIILGWTLATHSAEVVLNNTDVDICVRGEGDNTIKELLANLSTPENVSGIIYRENGRIVVNPQREYIKNLDALPMLPYEIFPMDKYIDSLSAIALNRKQNTINVSCGRGCPYNCNFCSKTFSGIRLRSIEKIIEEIKYLKSRYGIERIFFTDELLVVSKKRVLELCEKIVPLNINWSCQGRINLVDEELLIRMKDAGCTAIGYGVESGSQKILNAMNKQIDVRRSEEVIKFTKKVGLFPLIQAMYGYPGENMTTINETIEFFNEIDFPFVQFSPTTPLPGTELWQYSIKKGIITDEASFLERLEGGYMPDAPTLVNFTSFSNDELDRLRKWSESRIRLNYIKKHPIYAIQLIKNKLNEEGIKMTIKKIYTNLNYLLKIKELA